ncbi:divalent-cation tolerance protein CutA [Shewanella sp. 1_MG-2023]|jgi:periplasmic divalent cation tolerance protein|uniref:Divalent-cation tolerance protein CutA n=1 Tax=Shewanella electrodiphila TaxID=934143 RepID=A0ABT0KRE6_9GAMM|nr:MULTISPECIES: divalent-cation tolerance protein CutA [Shewanella]MCC4834836.1 divalent-cation tolerance protein CutA [Shewanella sp. 10N.7]MCL1046427.1 divalent-cation tolerance protein CutA [Shewanella electrodiphila]MDO6610646.1 divalent-cation tolerance protein CutA [Shewanella sp. 7_MG-2023]MDO6770771.1 divalent-cation tolerance protein CutA [Shewanella sp. 2_MG-2023]MDO6793211.1 divalent-cation tolerance protein CutA [Shewanella sp. 1_MG-2023]
MSANYLLVITTCPDIASAKKLATALVNAKVAACVQLYPQVESVYVWESEVCHSSEVAMHIKCMADNYDAIQKIVIDLHPYEVPELIATPITHGLPNYLHWIKETSQS